MNKKQTIFLVILITILHILTFYTCSKVEDWWGPVPKNPINDVIAVLLLHLCTAIDIIIISYSGIMLYDWLGEKNN